MTISVEITDFLKGLEDLKSRIENLEKDIPIMLGEWQQEDLNRKQPETTTIGEDTFTVIRSRGRFSTDKGVAKRAKMMGYRGPSRVLITVNRKGFNRHTRRKILRPELWEKLIDRAREMAGKVIKVR